MALIPVYPSLKVEIFVNGTQLPEYDNIDDKSSPQNLVTKYMRATVGVECGIRFIIAEVFSFPVGDLSAGVYFDGEYIETPYVRPESFLP